MTEQRFSSAKVQAEIYNKRIDEMTQEFGKGMASFLLKLPLSMSYPVWRHLHKVKGDWIE